MKWIKTELIKPPENQKVLAWFDSNQIIITQRIGEFWISDNSTEQD